METATYQGRAAIIKEGLETLKRLCVKFGLTPTSLFTPGAKQHFTFVETEGVSVRWPIRGIIEEARAVGDEVWIYLPRDRWLRPSMPESTWDGTWILKSNQRGAAASRGVLELH